MYFARDVKTYINTSEVSDDLSSPESSVVTRTFCLEAHCQFADTHLPLNYKLRITHTDLQILKFTTCFQSGLFAIEFKNKTFTVRTE